MHIKVWVEIKGFLTMGANASLACWNPRWGRGYPVFERLGYRRRHNENQWHVFEREGFLVNDEDEVCVKLDVVICEPGRVRQIKQMLPNVKVVTFGRQTVTRGDVSYILADGCQAEQLILAIKQSLHLPD